MSCIEKMTIQGIRSYGPKDQDTQVIEFFFPVTLIVGQNGCGKTTVIECLKFATTSDMPPNTKGSSFVFDPKLIDEVETKSTITSKCINADAEVINAFGGSFNRILLDLSELTVKRRKLGTCCSETWLSKKFF